MLLPAELYQSMKLWRRMTGPVAQIFKNGPNLPSFSCTIVQGPGYSLANPTTATSPQSDQHIVFTVTFGARPKTISQTFNAPGTYSAYVPDPTSWVITNGTLISIVAVSTTVWTVTINATSTGTVSLRIPAGSNQAYYSSIYGPNVDSGTVSVTFTPDAAVEMRQAYWIYASGIHYGEIVTTAPYTDYSGNALVMYVEPRVSADLTTLASVGSADFTGTNMTWTTGISQLADADTVLPGLYPTGWGICIEATYPSATTPYNAYCALRAGTAGNPLRTAFGGDYAAITSASLTVT